MKRLAISLLKALFLLALATSPAWADDGGAAAVTVAPVVTTPATNLISTLMNILMPVLLAAGAWIANRLVKAFESKVGVQVGETNYAKLMDIVDQGIHFAAEQASKAGNKKLEGSAKLKLAADYANSAMEKWGLEKMASDKLQQLVEARLSIAKADTSNQLFKP